jgi:hypothetical protein
MRLVSNTGIGISLGNCPARNPWSFESQGALPIKYGEDSLSFESQRALPIKSGKTPVVELTCQGLWQLDGSDP